MATNPRSASQQHQQLHRPIKIHSAWNKLVEVLRTEMNEEEVTSLSLDTVKDLAKHCGLDSALDLAHVELAWGERQGLLPNPQPLGGVWLGESQQPPPQQHQDPYAQPQFRNEDRGPVQQAPTSKRPVSTNKMSTVSKIPPRGRSASPLPKTAIATQQPGKVSFSKTQQAQPKAEVEGGNQGKLRPQNVKSRVDTGAKSRSKSPRNEMDEVICIEDMKEVFTKYAAFANGNPKEIDSSRFAKMCKECDFVDKLFTLRDADVLFMACKKSPADRRIPYHVFRMRLIPELASKKHKSIVDVVKLCNHHGGPRVTKMNAKTMKGIAPGEQDAPAPAAHYQNGHHQQEYEEEDVQENSMPPPPPPPASTPSPKGSSSARRMQKSPPSSMKR